MKDILNLFIDDSGSRHPDWETEKTGSNPDWFGLGGILVEERDRHTLESRYDEFRARWSDIEGPLHSVALRNFKGKFAPLGANAELRTQFLSELQEFIVSSPLVVTAAVIHRPGYRERYEGKYPNRERWKLCKTAFTILVERTTKWALSRNFRLRVIIEESDRKTDKRMESYYRELHANGMPFDGATSAAYTPLTAADFAKTFYEFETKTKASRLMQLADLCLYPVCAGRYKHYMPLDVLREKGKLIDDVVPAEKRASWGVKYSCFEAVPVPPSAASVATRA